MIKTVFDTIGKHKGSAFRALCLAAFFIIQSLTLSHAVEHNGEHHEHDGVVCDVMFIAADVDVVMPPVVIISEPESYITQLVYSVPQSPKYLRPDGRAPPGRSPPIH
ncbi:MAG: hypothetical protein ABJ275_06850 [Maricaulaceae bacterium]